MPRQPQLRPQPRLAAAGLASISPVLRWPPPRPGTRVVSPSASAALLPHAAAFVLRHVLT